MRSTTSPRAGRADARPAAAVPEQSLAFRVRRELETSGYAQLRAIQVSATGTGCVHLDGRVQSFYLKQLAQATALGIEGVHSVNNHLEVCAAG